MGRLRADLAIEKARVAQLHGDVVRGEIVISDALEELKSAAERIAVLEHALQDSDMSNQDIEVRNRRGDFGRSAKS